MAVAFAALLWIFLCSAAGATPNRWHRPIAYTLMVLAMPVLWLLWHQHGPAWAVGFFLMGIFQLRLLLMSWARKAVRHLKEARR